jgi:hypothetical protein
VHHQGQHFSAWNRERAVLPKRWATFTLYPRTDAFRLLSSTVMCWFAVRNNNLSGDAVQCGVDAVD